MSGQALTPDRELTVENWKPKHDRVLQLHLAGYQITTIADITGYSREWVSDLINDPRAQQRIEKMRERLYDQLEEDLAIKMKFLGPKAVENIRETLEGDHDPGSKAKKHQDKMSFELLDRIGHGKSSSDDERKGGGGVVLSGEDSERLVEAIEKSNKAREEHEVTMEQDEDGSYKPSEDDDS